MGTAQISKTNGPFELVDRDIPDPGTNTVRVAVDAFGVMNEVMPLAEVSSAFERMMSGKARFRVVLAIGPK
jgi:D-arabinose 1-dehydrogenase-like Zn-dependent alcohol dehydrogenase